MPRLGLCPILRRASYLLLKYPPSHAHQSLLLILQCYCMKSSLASAPCEVSGSAACCATLMLCCPRRHSSRRAPPLHSCTAIPCWLVPWFQGLPLPSSHAPAPSPVAGRLRVPSVPEECPEGAKDLMLQCLSVSPEARPTAQKAMQRLAQLQRSSPRASMDGRRDGA